MEENSYMEELKRRSGESKVYSEHQLMGLLIAEALGDEAHKALYMKLAKRYSADTLLKIAKDVSEREGIENKGAYFMKIISEMGILKNGKDPKAGK
ncbi:hypothetical protein A3A64_04505 [Candidatus Gottesmanbacteria bacterium RIFCSPLOWO2_01_FULL_48_11]|uniref:Uncharacterized protein n=2 Tax=Patescibacteria group TaxID=1783273 RepID=A0A1F6AT18_9BACT|nr:MAG: hypothetical protein A3A64_04505 [Candidatus Gottesmanbacteria bacterium RIFCSPLOWO2_01_FULL_48_11]OGY57006.1 MAG: hypothetical protein A2119_00295 [Candidatus Colwellbacteria bacterium GWA2_46_10]